MPIVDGLASADDATPGVRGWCPGAWRPMRAADGWVVRIKPWCGRVSGEQALGLAALARYHAYPTVTLTQRAHLQLRGVSDAALPALQDGLRALGLLDADARCEARRNVLVQPFWRAGDDTDRLADALSTALCARPSWYLPAKFGFAVDTGQQPCLRAASADIRLERIGTDAVLVRADGASAGRVVAMADAAEAALALADAFVRGGGVANGRPRMARWVQQGVLPQAWQTHPCVASATLDAPVLGPTPVGWLVGVAWGQLSADTLARLGSRSGLRLTPWRALLCEGDEPPPAAPEWIWDDRDPRWRAAVCTGLPGCANSGGYTQALAQALLPDVPRGVPWHVTGCAKGCANASAAWTVRMGPQGWEWLGWARAGDEARSKGESLEALRECFRKIPT